MEASKMAQLWRQGGSIMEARWLNYGGKVQLRIRVEITEAM
jgi:hypothetical protein